MSHKSGSYNNHIILRFINTSQNSIAVVMIEGEYTQLTHRQKCFNGDSNRVQGNRKILQKEKKIALENENEIALQPSHYWGDLKIRDKGNGRN